MAAMESDEKIEICDLCNEPLNEDHIPHSLFLHPNIEGIMDALRKRLKFANKPS
jgi:hypothetical protein